MTENDPVPWLEHPLGRFDVPQVIQCRVCKRYKHADKRAFRNIRSSDRYRTTCRQCEHATAYGRRLSTRIRRIQLDSQYPDAIKQMLIAEAKADIPRIRAAAALERVDKQFAAHWKQVRALVARRREMIVNIISSSKHASSGLHAKMLEHPVVEQYVRTLLDLYSTIIERLRSAAKWQAMIGNRFPPTYWQVLYRGPATSVASGSQAWQPRTPSVEELMTVNPLDFSTYDERRLLAAVPLQEDDNAVLWLEWNEFLYYGRTTRFHLYPHWNEQARETKEKTPDWLREFNGYINS